MISNLNRYKKRRNFYFFASILFALFFIFLPEFSYAQDRPAVFEGAGNIACIIARTVNSYVVRACATIALIIVGFYGFAGKLQWWTIYVAALGVFISFGAVKIITTLAENINSPGVNQALIGCVE